MPPTGERRPRTSAPSNAQPAYPTADVAAPPSGTARVLVTGASGFLGASIARFLDERGWEVVRASSVAREGFAAVDLLDDAAVRTLLCQIRPTHLVHAAWRAVNGDVMRSPENVTWMRASVALVQAFREAGGQRAAVLGSAAEYDWSSGICRNGVTPLRPATVYGTCKHALRHALEAHAQATGSELVWPRVFFVYGPNEHESRLTASVIRALVRGETAACTEGRQVRDYMHVDDVAAGVVAALESDHQGAVDIASGTGVSIRELVTRIAQAIGREELLRLGALAPPSHDVPLVVGDRSEAASKLGWEPVVSLDEGIAHTLAHGRLRFAKTPLRTQEGLRETSA